jgi:hypothetical protein
MQAHVSDRPNRIDSRRLSRASVASVRSVRTDVGQYTFRTETVGERTIVEDPMNELIDHCQISHFKVEIDAARNKIQSHESSVAFTLLRS